MNKNIKNILYTGCLALALTTSLSSCEDYLDKSPEATVSSEDAFKTFKNFQGFIEEIYNCVPDKEKCNGLLLGTGVTMKSSIPRQMQR